MAIQLSMIFVRTPLALFLLAFSVFFGRSFLSGLSPDAALYAGLSLKVLQSGEFWRLSASEGFFPNFFEHPPYFFQWGALVLKLFGQSDGAARAIGAIPGLLGLFALLAWALLRLGFSRACLLLLMLLSFGHYTKYASTSQMESSLSLGVILCVIACVEFFYSSRNRISMFVLCALGSFLAVASKGAAGLGCLGGVGLSVMAFQFLRVGKVNWRDAFFLILSSFVGAILPLALWAYFTYPSSLGGVWEFREYWVQQVFRSFSTNRGSELHVVGGSRWRYLQVILKYGWPWWWTVPAGWFCFFRKTFFLHMKLPVMSLWFVSSFCFFLAFFVPFSLSAFQLPHYIHPIYLPLAPVGAWFLYDRLPVQVTSLLSRPRWIWGLLILTSVIMLSYFRGVSSASNRGQEFFQVATLVNAVPKDCRLLVSEDAVDPYRMEAFALWYFKGRPWARLERSSLKESSLTKKDFAWLLKPDNIAGSQRFLFSKSCHPN